jgi:ribosomal protein S12 methylthiotransferase accessory factor
MWARVSPHLTDYGITRVAHLTHLDRIGVPVHMAMKPAGRTLSSGSGKGLTELASRLSAVMEAAEQSCWEASRPDTRVATQDELAAGHEPYVPFARVALLRDHIITTATPLRWVQFWDIVGGEAVWAPLNTVALPTDPRYDTGGVLPSSNGLASGSHVVEAMLSGLAEVIERDAVTLGYVTGSMRALTPRPDPSSTWGPVVERIEAAGLWLRISDCTTDDIGMPTFHARLDDPGGGVGSFAGYGAALDSDVAVTRAVTEAVQARCVIVAGARDDMFQIQRRGGMRLSRRPKPVDDVVGTDYAPVDLSGRSLVDDLTTAVSLLRRAGFDRVLVHRYSAPGDPVQAVRVLVPGLEGYRMSGSALGERARQRLAAVQAAP